MKTKTELYCKKYLKILNIIPGYDSNNTFFLKDLDNDENKQNLILELELDIRKYFVCGHWSCFNSPNVKIKNIIKFMNYNVIFNRKFRKNEGILYRNTIYYFIKNNSI